MKNFLKKSSVLVLIGLVLVTFCSMTYNKNDDATIIAEEPNKATKIETFQQAQDVLKKSEETKINYSNTIHVLVTPKQKLLVQDKIANMNQEIEMLAKVIYREARGESKEY